MRKRGRKPGREDMGPEQQRLYASYTQLKNQHRDCQGGSPMQRTVQDGSITAGQPPCSEGLVDNGCATADDSLHCRQQSSPLGKQSKSVLLERYDSEVGNGARVGVSAAWPTGGASIALRSSSKYVKFGSECGRFVTQSRQSGV
eukprot:scaffold7_cov378-Prasinococcus_capsulatus_cf.AAC.14